MAMARGMLRQKLKLSIPITSYIMQRKAMVFRRAMVLLMGVSTRVMALNMVATTRDLLKLMRNLLIIMASVDMGITNLGGMALDTKTEVSARRSFIITTNEMLRIPVLT